MYRLTFSFVLLSQGAKDTGGVEEEDRERGVVAWEVWKEYVLALGVGTTVGILTLYVLQVRLICLYTYVYICI